MLSSGGSPSGRPLALTVSASAARETYQRTSAVPPCLLPAPTRADELCAESHQDSRFATCPRFKKQSLIQEVQHPRVEGACCAVASFGEACCWMAPQCSASVSLLSLETGRCLACPQLLRRLTRKNHAFCRRPASTSPRAAGALEPQPLARPLLPDPLGFR